MNVKQKLLLLIMSVCCVAAAFSQTNEDVNTSDSIGGGVYKDFSNKLTISLDLNSGTLVDNTTGILSGNGLEAAIEYQRTLSTVSWLSFYGKISVKTALNPINYNLKNLDQNATDADKVLYPEYKLTGMDNPSFSLNYLEGGVRFGNYGSIALRNGFRILAEGQYPVKLPFENTIIPYVGINAYPYRIGSFWTVPENDYGIKAVEGQAKSASIQDLYVGLKWQIALEERLNLGIDFSWRTNGAPSTGLADVQGNMSLWKIDSLAALKYNTAFRLNATASYQVTKAFAPYLQLRYDGQYVIATPTPITNYRWGKPMHDVKIRAGFTYQLGN
ncbi:MAG: hypothetical protein IKW26_07220 [Treponema sp.]|nr:hypothetical protein [Treponema sp.]